MKLPYEIVRRPLITEKSHWLTERNRTYAFDVDPKATKDEIKKAVEALYAHKGVRVDKVRTLRVEGKRRRYRGIPGQTTLRKKALVTLKEGQTIDLF